jgi:hypothetical protein
MPFQAGLDPESPLVSTLNRIAAHFDTELRPQCERYIESPPRDAKKRDVEHIRLSETVMQQVILKLDEVDTAGDEGARTFRKRLVHDVQDVLKRVDDIHRVPSKAVRWAVPETRKAPRTGHRESRPPVEHDVGPSGPYPTHFKVKESRQYGPSDVKYVDLRYDGQYAAQDYY